MTNEKQINEIYVKCIDHNRTGYHSMVLNSIKLNCLFESLWTSDVSAENYAGYSLREDNCTI